MFYADESGQSSPQIRGMGSLVSAGGIYVPGESSAQLHEKIEYICGTYGCPPRDEFKWNAPKNSWLRQLGDRRPDFVGEILEACIESGVTAIVVIVEKGHYKKDETHLTKAFQWLLERVEFTAQEHDEVCAFIADRRSDSTNQDDEFVGDLLETIYDGTEFVLPKSIIWAVSSDSRNIRAIQIADLITGCATQFVAGRTTHSEQHMAKIYRLLRKDSNGKPFRHGLKLWPDKLYEQMPTIETPSPVVNDRAVGIQTASYSRVNSLAMPVDPWPHRGGLN